MVPRRNAQLRCLPIEPSMPEDCVPHFGHAVPTATPSFLTRTRRHAEACRANGAGTGEHLQSTCAIVTWAVRRATTRAYSRRRRGSTTRRTRIAEHIALGDTVILASEAAINSYDEISQGRL